MIEKEGEWETHAMAKEFRTQAFCNVCGRPTLHVRAINTPNHVLHLLITIFLCGFWLPIWLLLIVTAKKDRLRCALCGQPHV